jgi:hypothetical protein|tara:strand:+ start:1038 stop:1238 length:201 start_codon:yes stop_codon:yes gene_type:complete
MERAIVCTKYDYYKYYNARKEFYKMNYLEKKRKDTIHDQYKDYFKNYWTLLLWKEENMREYKKNNI